jgi:hypothetical protein
MVGSPRTRSGPQRTPHARADGLTYPRGDATRRQVVIQRAGLDHETGTGGVVGDEDEATSVALQGEPIPGLDQIETGRVGTSWSAA